MVVSGSTAFLENDDFDGDDLQSGRQSTHQSHLQIWTVQGPLVPIGRRERSWILLLGYDAKDPIEVPYRVHRLDRRALRGERKRSRP